MKELLDIQVTIKCGFAVKWLRDMTRTYSPVIPNRLVCKKQLMIENKFLVFFVFCI